MVNPAPFFRKRITRSFAPPFWERCGVNPLKNFLSTSPSKTKKLGEILAKEILKTRRAKKALILDLEGDLGGGKTTFLQGFAKGLGIRQRILSPTFIILKKFSIFPAFDGIPSRRDNSQFSNFYHIDCYRLKKPEEILSLGFKEIISNPKNIVAIEWADRIRRLLPKDVIVIRFKFVDQNSREIKIVVK